MLSIMCVFSYFCKADFRLSTSVTCKFIFSKACIFSLVFQNESINSKFKGNEALFNNKGEVVVDLLSNVKLFCILSDCVPKLLTFTVLVHIFLLTVKTHPFCSHSLSEIHNMIMN